MEKEIGEIFKLLCSCTGVLAMMISTRKMSRTALSEITNKVAQAQKGLEELLKKINEREKT